MALIVFLRGINVGGHRTFRPSMFARDLAAYDVVNVGAAGTFVVRKPVSRTKFLAELRRKLPFEAAVSFCDARDLIRLEMENPFGAEPFDQDVVRFVPTDANQELRNIPAKVRYGMKRPAISKCEIAGHSIVS